MTTGTGRPAPSRDHELRNQLTVILGFADLLLRGTPADDPRYGDLVVIRDAATSALRILGTPPAGSPPPGT